METCAVTIVQMDVPIGILQKKIVTEGSIVIGMVIIIIRMKDKVAYLISKIMYLNYKKKEGDREYV